VPKKVPHMSYGIRDLTISIIIISCYLNLLI